jgi:hypothetical protein
MPSTDPEQTVEVRHAVSFEGHVVVSVKDPDVIDRVTDPVRGEEWRKQCYQLFTPAEVLQHLAYNCIANGAERANQLDGWADLPDDAATMGVESIEPTGEVITEEATHA